MLREDAEAFRATLEDLCVAFNRPCTDQLVRVFWDALKNVPIHEVKRSALSARNNLKKFPTPKELIPERRHAEPPKPMDDGPPMSPWAVAANKILFHVAYRDPRRGFKPIGDILPRLLTIKADYVQMAEQAELSGEPMDGQEYQAMCKEGFEKALGIIA